MQYKNIAQNTGVQSMESLILKLAKHLKASYLVQLMATKIKTIQIVPLSLPGSSFTGKAIERLWRRSKIMLVLKLSTR
jgi:hypothetical protein